MPQRGNLAVGPMAVMLRAKGGIPTVRQRGRHALNLGPEQRWRDAVGSAFLYTAANWGAVTWYLEVFVRDVSGKALARLYDVTAAAGVADSVITDDDQDAAGYERKRSSAITLVDGHEYRVQFGVQDGGMVGAIGAKLIAR